MQIDLLRHGACEGGRIFRGHIDVPLTAQGWQQMRSGLARLTPDWQQIISSPLTRCAEFSQQLATQAQLPLTLEAGIKEISFGAWEGQPVAKIWREQQALCLAWSRAPEQNGPPGGEPFGDFKSRVLAALARLAQLYPSERLLLVTHGGVIKLLLSVARAMPPSGMMQLNISYGFAASLTVNDGQLTVQYPQASAYVYPE